MFQASSSYAEELRIGVTFSPKQSEYLEQEWKEVYLEILDMGFDMIRLGAYWSEIEPKEGLYDFRVLDWQIRQAHKKGVPVLLTVGMKSPRWPEYFIPKWVHRKTRLSFGKDLAESEYLTEKTLQFMSVVVQRYRRESIIHYWQVENEPLERSGPMKWWINKDFLEQEIELVRELDKRGRPIVLNVATYPNGMLRFLHKLTSPNIPISEAAQLCDILAINVYPMVGHKLWKLKLRFKAGIASHKEYLTKVIDTARSQGKEVWATELQAEPWEPGELVHKGKEGPTTAWPEGFMADFDQLSDLGVRTIFLWGAEYWNFRKTKHKDESWNNAALEILKRR